jgi:hypothetical protein
MSKRAPSEKVRTNIYLRADQRGWCKAVAEEVTEKTGEECSMADVVRVCISMMWTLDASLAEDVARRPPFFWIAEPNHREILKTLYEMKTGDLELNEEMPVHSLGPIDRFLTEDGEYDPPEDAP